MKLKRENNKEKKHHESKAIVWRDLQKLPEEEGTSLVIH